MQLDCLVRSVRYLFKVIEQLSDNAASFRSIADSIDTTTLRDVFGLQVLSAVAELERQHIAVHAAVGSAMTLTRVAFRAGPCYWLAC